MDRMSGKPNPGRGMNDVPLAFICVLQGNSGVAVNRWRGALEGVCWRPLLGLCAQT